MSQPLLHALLLRPLDRLLPVEGDDDDPDVDVDGEDDQEHDEGDAGVAQVIVDLCVREKTTCFSHINPREQTQAKQARPQKYVHVMVFKLIGQR